MATINAINNSSAPFTVTSGDLTASGTYSKAVGATAQALLVDSTGLIGGLAGAANTIFVGGTKPSFTATPQCTDLTLTGKLDLPTTSSSTVGVIRVNSSTWAHSYGTNNIFIGNGAGNFTFNTAYNNGCVGIGTSVLSSLNGNGSYQGTLNTSVGYLSGISVTTGYRNSFYGYHAGYQLTTGIGNLLCGYNTGTSYTSDESFNIILGYSIAGTAGEDNVLRIGDGTGTGNGQINAAYISGITGKTSTGGAAVYVNSSNLLGTSTSNRDSKQNIADMGDDSSVIYNLRPRTFEFKSDSDPKPKQFGMIAEEVEEVFPEMVLYDKDGKPWNLAYQFLAPMLVNEIQKLSQKVTLLEQRIADLEP